MYHRFGFSDYTWIVQTRRPDFILRQADCVLLVVSFSAVNLAPLSIINPQWLIMVDKPLTGVSICGQFSALVEVGMRDQQNVVGFCEGSLVQNLAVFQTSRVHRDYQ